MAYVLSPLLQAEKERETVLADRQKLDEQKAKDKEERFNLQQEKRKLEDEKARTAEERKQIERERSEREETARKIGDEAAAKEKELKKKARFSLSAMLLLSSFSSARSFFSSHSVSKRKSALVDT